MASSPRDFDERESDTECEAIDPGNFERGFRRGHKKEKDGLMYRLSGRCTQRNIELKKENVRLEEENNALREQLMIQNEERQESNNELYAIIRECSGLQIGDGNTLNVSNSEDLLPLIRQILNKTTSDKEEILQKLALSELDLKITKKYLERIHTEVVQIREHTAPKERMEELQEIIQVTAESTETNAYSIIQNGLECIRTRTDWRQFNDFNKISRDAIRLIVYKFGLSTTATFVDLLGIQMQKEMASKESFDENSCARIILNWFRKETENTVDVLIEILKRGESMRVQESMDELRGQYEFTENTTPDKQRSTDCLPNVFKKREIADSLPSLTLSNCSAVSETLEKFAKHASDSLQNPDIKPDHDAIMCAMYMLHMENSRQLQIIDEKVSSSHEHFV